MAFAATNITGEPRSFSLGPLKMQLMDYTAANADTSGTATADALTTITKVVTTGGLNLTAAVTSSGNVATLAFADPGAGGAFGTLIIFGR